MKKVIVASMNPVKINSVKLGFEKMLPGEEFEFVGVSAPSDVPDQPMGDEETLRGAMNRGKNAKQMKPDAQYWVGIEGGLIDSYGELTAIAWIVINSQTLSGKSKTSSFVLPEKIATLVRAGHELGDADDMAFDQTNSKQKGGTVSNLTNGVIDRTGYYVGSVVLALIPFVNTELY